MKSLKLSALLLIAGSAFLFACNEGVKKDEKTVDVQDLTKNQPEVHGTELKEGDITLNTLWIMLWLVPEKALMS